jgi:hypothetical protein
MRRVKSFLIICGVLALAHSDAAAGAPAGRYVTSAQSVLDSATQLNWERRPSAGTYTFTQAEQHCSSLMLDGSIWRVPTVTELLTLVDETRGMPAIDPKAFPGAASEYYWSSSESKSSATEASAVSFRFGFDAVLGKDSPQLVRCVR